VPPRLSQPDQRPQRLAPLDPDPLASLKIWAVEVLSWRIPPLDAATWLNVLLAPELDLEAIFPGFCDSPTQMEVNMALLMGELDQEELADAILEAIEEISGRKWWVTLRLVRVFRSTWEVTGGLLASHGVDPRGMPLAAWLDVAYRLLIDRISEQNPKTAAEISAKIAALPPNVAREVDDVAEGNAFLAAMRAAG
jgi:hypothetical protein